MHWKATKEQSALVVSLQFAADIDGLAGKEEELVNLVEHLDSTSTAYGKQISAEKNQADD